MSFELREFLRHIGESGILRPTANWEPRMRWQDYIAADPAVYHGQPIDAPDGAFRYALRNAPPRTTSGLIGQQRLFAPLRP